MNRDETEIDVDLLIQQMREEQIWQMRDWQNEILAQWEGSYATNRPNSRSVENFEK
jgi:hypothetical protein